MVWTKPSFLIMSGWWLCYFHEYFISSMQRLCIYMYEDNEDYQHQCVIWNLYKEKGIRSAYAMFHIIDPCIRVTIKKLLQMNEENNKNFKLSDIELIMIWPYRNYNMQLKVLNNVACDEKKNDKDILNRNLVNSFENILDQVSINSPFCIKLEIRTCRSDVASLGRPI